MLLKIHRPINFQTQSKFIPYIGLKQFCFLILFGSNMVNQDWLYYFPEFKYKNRWKQTKFDCMLIQGHFPLKDMGD